MIVVYNPTAGRRRARLLWQVLDVLLAAGTKVELAETRHPGHAFALARTAAQAGAAMVVAAGGDGTVAEVAGGLAGSATRLGIIPLGTANVLANELGLGFLPTAVAGALAMGRTRRIWPGIVEQPAADGGTVDRRLFVQMLGAGFDAQVVHRLPLTLKRVLGRGAYVLQTLRELGRYDYRPIELCIDGVRCRAVGVIVSKGRFYAGRYLLAPGMSPTERGFTVALFDRAGSFSTMAYGSALTLGLLPRMPGVRLMRADRVEIIGCTAPAQADGDDAGCAPLVITTAPDPLEVLVG